MTLDDAIQAINACVKTMNEKYGGVVFDEWIIVELGETDRILAHSGPRQEEIVLDFGTDTEAIHQLLQTRAQSIGDFGFTPEGHGTRFDAYTHIGKNLYVLWNRTDRRLIDLTPNRNWPEAHLEFTKLAEVFKNKPVQ
jgi:hypothetical protein